MADSRDILEFDESGTVVTGYKDESVTKIIIPKGVKYIGYAAFSNCTRLTSIEIPNSVTKIGESAFHGCTGLSSIEIPNSVMEIGGEVFYGYTGLRELHIRHEHPEKMVFRGFPFYGIENCILYVPIGTGYAYRHHPAFKGKFKEVRTER